MKVLDRLRLRRLDGRREPDLRALEARVHRLESGLEGLQDAMHRLFVQQNERLDELSQRTRPEEIARALSQDARERGL
jgi:hypothetical protein